MRPDQCQMDARVALHLPAHRIKLPLQKGNISGAVDGLYVQVDWDDGNRQKITLRSLLSEEESLLVEEQLEKSALEKDGGNLQLQLKVKLNQAAQLIKEASVLASKHSKTIYLDFPDESLPLETALQEAGWHLT